MGKPSEGKKSARAGLKALDKARRTEARKKKNERREKVKQANGALARKENGGRTNAEAMRLARRAAERKALAAAGNVSKPEPKRAPPAPTVTLHFDYFDGATLYRFADPGTAYDIDNLAGMLARGGKSEREAQQAALKFTLHTLTRRNKRGDGYLRLNVRGRDVRAWKRSEHHYVATITPWTLGDVFARDGRVAVG